MKELTSADWARIGHQIGGELGYYDRITGNIRAAETVPVARRAPEPYVTAFRTAYQQATLAGQVAL